MKKLLICLLALVLAAAPALGEGTETGALEENISITEAQ